MADLDLPVLQQKRANAEAAGDTAAVARYDQRIAAAQEALSKAPAGPDQTMETIKDVGQSVPAGLREGAEGLMGMGGNIYNLEVTLAEKLAKWLGASPETMKSITDARGKGWLGDSADAKRKITDPLLGDAATHEPTTGAGRWAKTGASMLPGAGGGSMMRTVVGPTIGTELGDDVVEHFGGGEEAQQWGKLAGGIAGGMAPQTSMRTVAGPGMNADRINKLDTLAREGVPVTAGQASGNKRLKHIETGPTDSGPAISERQNSAFTRAALRRAGIDSPEGATPDAMTNARDAMGLEYDDVVRRNNGVPLDNDLQTDVLDAVMRFERLKGTGPGTPTAVRDYFQRISDAAQQNGGVVPADVFQSIRSDISKDLRLSKDAEVIQTLRQFQDAMFDSISRNGQGQLVGDLRDLNQRYRNLKIIEGSMTGGGEETTANNITPKKLRGSVERNDKGAMVYGRGDFRDLANAGESMMTPLPNSGTAGRMAGPVAGLGGAAAALLNGDPKMALMAAGAGVSPWVASKIANSGPGQRALMSQVTGRSGSVLNPVTLALLERQAQLSER